MNQDRPIPCVIIEADPGTTYRVSTGLVEFYVQYREDDLWYKRFSFTDDECVPAGYIQRLMAMPTYDFTEVDSGEYLGDSSHSDSSQAVTHSPTDEGGDSS